MRADDLIERQIIDGDPIEHAGNRLAVKLVGISGVGCAGAPCHGLVPTAQWCGMAMNGVPAASVTTRRHSGISLPFSAASACWKAWRGWLVLLLAKGQHGELIVTYRGVRRNVGGSNEQGKEG
jgi:hypothetical protein